LIERPDRYDFGVVRDHQVPGGLVLKEESKKKWRMLMIQIKTLAMMVLGVSLAFAGRAQADLNLLVDGSFESAPLGETLNGGIGDGAWTVTSSGANLFGLIVAGTASTGNMYFGATLPADPLTSGIPQAGGTHVAYFVGDTETDTLSQTISLTAGLTYQVGFDVTPTFTGGHNPGLATLSATFAGDTLFSQTTASLSTPTTETDDSTWTHFGYNFTATSTGPGTFTFTFSTGQVPSQDVLIDRVYVGLASDVVSSPEPSTLIMLVGGAVSLAVVRRFKRRSV
jgi:hypothetical protein